MMQPSTVYPEVESGESHNEDDEASTSNRASLENHEIHDIEDEVSIIYPVSVQSGENYNTNDDENHSGQEDSAFHHLSSKESSPRYAEKSLGIFPLNSRFRQAIIKIVAPGNYFDTFVLFMIILNSIAMACADYQYVDENYAPSAELSLRNEILEKVEILFIILFLLECVMKVIANGFAFGENAYLKNHWNKFDFMVVVFSIMTAIPVLPNLSMLRSFRVIRPLRSVAILPGLRKVVGSLIDSIGDLFNVMLLLAFLLVCFSITGVLFWNGLLHARCRLTPFPIIMPKDCNRTSYKCWDEFISKAILDPGSYRCLADANNDKDWTQSTSPWFLKGPQDCIWPIDSDDERVCTMGENGGYHVCSPIYLGEGNMINRTCGSNFDAFGNPRFINSNEPFGYPRMKSGVFIEGLNWGFTNYDSFFSSFVTTFQVITLEGWTDIMYQVIDAWSFAPTVMIFSIQIILCGYIVLNLVLAVITKSLDNIEEEEKILMSTRAIQPSSEVEQSTRFKTRYFADWVDSKYHSTAIMGCIVINTVILSMDYYGISEEKANLLENLNLVFTLIFLIDVIICNEAYGLKKYWSNPFTCFDGVIAIVSVAELIAMQAISGSETEGPSSFSVFRSLRLFRVFKMAKRWKSLQSLLKTMTDSVQEIGNFAILLVLFMFIYALVGMQILSNRLRFHPETGAAIGILEDGYYEASVPRPHFDNFFWSMVTVFQLLSGENWNAVMYDGWRARGWVAVSYFLSLVIIGVFIVMNLFLAILIKRFDDNEDLIDFSKLDKAIATQNNTTESTLKGGSPGLSNKRPSTIQILWSKLGKDNLFRKLCFRVVENPKFDNGVTFLILFSSICLALDNPLVNPESPRVKFIRGFDIIFTVVFILEMVVKIFAYGFITEKGSYMRNPWNVLDFVVVNVSILNLANIGPGKALRVLRTMRVLRPLRMINRLPELKVVVDALLLSFPAVGNVAVLNGLFFLIFSSFGVNFLKGTFYHCYGDSFGQLSTDQIDYITNPFEWGELSIEQQDWFNTTSSYCSANMWTSSTIPTSREVCDCLAPGEWVLVIPQNFNNVLNGMALLFEIATTEGWVDVMYAAIDQRGIDSQPVRDSSPLWALFFITFLVIGAFFVLELFVGVTIDNFNKIRDRTGRGIMTEAQREWAATQAFIVKIKPEKRIQRPSGYLRARCYDFVMPGINPKFHQAITICIILNCICTAIVSFGDSEEKKIVLEWINAVFTGIFTIEVILNLVALKMRYFNDGWNKFDFIVVCGSNIGLFLSLFVPNTETFASVIRLFRICRLVRLIKSIKKLRTLFNTMIMSVPSIANIGTLLFLLFFIYSVAGMQLYSFIPENEDLTEHASFRSFGSAMLLLLRFATGENWNGFMRSLVPSNENCDPNPMYNASSPWCLTDEDYPDCTEINGCGAGISGFVYFYSFTLLVSFVILNLFVGVVLEAFENSEEGEILSPEDLEKFTAVWAEFDPEATWHIKAEDIMSFLLKLEPPLGIGSEDVSKVQNLMNDQCMLDLPISSDGKANIVHVATHLAKRLAIMKQGEDFHELSDDHPIQKRIFSHKTASQKTLKDVYDMNRPKQKLRALQAFAKKIPLTSKQKQSSKIHPISSSSLKQDTDVT